MGDIVMLSDRNRDDENPVSFFVLDELIRQHWAVYLIGPMIRVAVRRGASASDVIVFQSERVVVVFRAAATFGADPLRSRYVWWHSTRATASQVVTGTARPDTISAPYRTPQVCKIPELDTWPMTRYGTTQQSASSPLSLVVNRPSPTAGTSGPPGSTITATAAPHHLDR
jgi:hypothetical protein